MHIKYILSHPVQYQSPFIRYLVKKGIKISVLYRSDISIKKHFDKEFGKKIKWDVDLLNGYQYNFLKYIGPNKLGIIFPLTTEFFGKIFDDKTDIIWIHGIKNWYNICIIILSKCFNKKIFVRDEVHQFSKNRTYLNNLFNYLFYQIIDKFIDVYLSVGTVNKKYYIKNKISEKKIVKVPWAVDNHFFYKEKKKNNTFKKKRNINIVFLFAGKLTYRKGPDLLLESIKILNKSLSFSSNSEFLIVGDGEMKKDLIEFSKKNNLKNVKFFPFQNQRNLSKFYKKSDVFVLPSRIGPWELAINEAMSAENAIIAANQIGATYDLVKKNKNGFTFKNDDHKDLARKILLIYKNNKKIKYYKKNSLKIISKWEFKQCYVGLQKAIKCVSKKK